MNEPEHRCTHSDNVPDGLPKAITYEQVVAALVVLGVPPEAVSAVRIVPGEVKLTTKLAPAPREGARSLHSQTFSYGYQVPAPLTLPATL